MGGRQPGQDTDMLGATALCGYNRVTSAHMVPTEPQSQSQGPSRRETSLGLRDPCQEVACRSHEGQGTYWLQSMASR